ncbi:MAG: glycosyltransferase [Thermoguttaceae bacterium]|nr:glycosyltransferase [Thermoguttaceae bacterium]
MRRRFQDKKTYKTKDGRTRVAFLITELAPGGAEKALVHLVLSLDRERFEPVVYSLSGREIDCVNSLAPFLRANGVETVELGMRSVLGLPSTLWRLRTLLKRQAPILAQSFMFHANLLGRFAARAAGVPIVCSGIRVAEHDSKLRLTLDRLTRRLVDVWVCVGEAAAEFTRTVGRIPTSRVVSIPNGVKTMFVDGRVRVMTAGFAVASLQKGENYSGSLDVPPGFGVRKRLIAVGRLTEQKGFDWLLENARKWLTKERASDWELWIVGDGKEKERLLSIVAAQGLQKDVFFTGWRADAGDLVDQSEVFLLPSRWEGTPNVLLEAAATGKPALCARVEGVEEILGMSDPQTCDWGDVDAWASKCVALMENEELRVELGRRNQERVLKEFTIERTTEEYVRLWTKLAENKGLSF